MRRLVAVAATWQYYNFAAKKVIRDICNCATYSPDFRSSQPDQSPR